LGNLQDALAVAAVHFEMQNEELRLLVVTRRKATISAGQ
jgi:hypothetical protein